MLWNRNRNAEGQDSILWVSKKDWHLLEPLSEMPKPQREMGFKKVSWCQLHIFLVYSVFWTALHVFFSLWHTPKIPVFHLYYYHSLSNPILVKNDLTEPNLCCNHHYCHEAKLNITHVRCASLLLQDDNYSILPPAKKLEMCSTIGVMLQVKYRSKCWSDSRGGK